jgi:VWFA-related protein
MDKTGSILTTLPVLKNSIVRFIDESRGDDWIAVYEFNTSLRKSQDFTGDKSAAKRAVLRVTASGATALYDALSQVLLDLSNRKGKKMIVTFTDGQDNSSYLSSEAVKRRAKSFGIPLYFVAQGEALREPQLMKNLREMSQATSGSTYPVRAPSEMAGVFDGISRDLHNSYLMTYVPPPINDAGWRIIRLTAKGVKAARISAREGYFPFPNER